MNNHIEVEYNLLKNSKKVKTRLEKLLIAIIDNDLDTIKNIYPTMHNRYSSKNLTISYLDLAILYSESNILKEIITINSDDLKWDDCSKLLMERSDLDVIKLAYDDLNHSLSISTIEHAIAYSSIDVIDFSIEYLKSNIKETQSFENLSKLVISTISNNQAYTKSFFELLMKSLHKSANNIDTAYEAILMVFINLNGVKDPGLFKTILDELISWEVLSENLELGSNDRLRNFFNKLDGDNLVYAVDKLRQLIPNSLIPSIYTRNDITISQFKDIYSALKKEHPISGFSDIFNHYKGGDSNNYFYNKVLYIMTENRDIDDFKTAIVALEYEEPYSNFKSDLLSYLKLLKTEVNTINNNPKSSKKDYDAVVFYKQYLVELEKIGMLPDVKVIDTKSEDISI